MFTGKLHGGTIKKDMTSQKKNIEILKLYKNIINHNDIKKYKHKKECFHKLYKERNTVSAVSFVNGCERSNFVRKDNVFFVEKKNAKIVFRKEHVLFKAGLALKIHKVVEYNRLSRLDCDIKLLNNTAFKIVRVSYSFRNWSFKPDCIAYY